jgi:hypothetical protein
MLAAALIAVACLGAAAAEPTLPDIKDAFGPITYKPAARPLLHKLRGGLIAAGFCAVGFYWLVRRRRRRKRQVQAATRADAPLPEEGMLALEPGEFYAHLASLLRKAMTDAGEEGAGAWTPLAMSATSPPAAQEGEDIMPRWQDFWARAEEAEYAAVPVPEAERRADLAFVTELLKRMHTPRTRGGGNAT